MAKDKKTQEESDAEAAAEAAGKAALAEAQEAAGGLIPTGRIITPRASDDEVDVLCLKDNPTVSMGGRYYVLKTGATIPMLRGHAIALSQTGWVAYTDNG